MISGPGGEQDGGMDPHPRDRFLDRLDVAVAVCSVLVLLVVAASLPLMGFAAAESLENEKFYRVFEGDWMFLFSLIAAGACISGAIRQLRRLFAA
jgi:hypothetical protein